MALESDREAERELSVRIPDRGTVQELCTASGELALLGLDFYFRDPSDLRVKRVRLEHLNSDGKTYQAWDVQRKEMLGLDVAPGNLTIGLALRRDDEQVIRALKAARIDHKPFLDPFKVQRAPQEEFHTAASGFKDLRQIGGSAPPAFLDPNRMQQRAFIPRPLSRNEIRTPGPRFQGIPPLQGPRFGGFKAAGPRIPSPVRPVPWMIPQFPAGGQFEVQEGVQEGRRRTDPERRGGNQEGYGVQIWEHGGRQWGGDGQLGEAGVADRGQMNFAKEPRGARDP